MYTQRSGAGRTPWGPSTCAGDLRGLLMVALRSQGNWRCEGPLGTPLGLVHWKRASSPVEAMEPIVSTCGTAITPTQAERVLTLAERVFFCFDGDAAGAKATGRAAKMLLPLVSDLHARGNDTGGPCQGPRHGGHAVATHYRTWPLDILSTIRLRSPTAVAPRLRPCCGNGPDGRTQRTRTSVPMLRGPGNGPSRGR